MVDSSGTVKCWVVLTPLLNVDNFLSKLTKLLFPFKYLFYRGQTTICKVLSLKLSESTEGRSRQKANGTHRTMPIPWKLRCSLLRHCDLPRTAHTSAEGAEGISMGFGASTAEAPTMKPWQWEIIFTHSSFLFIPESQNGSGGKGPLKDTSSTPPHNYLETSFHSGHSFLLMRLRAWKIERQESEHTHPAASTHTHWQQPAWNLVTPLGTEEGSREKTSIRQRWRYKASSTILN